MGVARRVTPQVHINWQKPQTKSMESRFHQSNPADLSANRHEPVVHAMPDREMI